MAGGSETITTWALAILAGSIAAVISSDYLRPSGPVKLVYLLFIPGWFLLGVSLYYADQLNSSYMASIFAIDKAILVGIGSNMNSELLHQKNFLAYALLAFALWLLLFLLWWIFFKQNEEA